MSCSKEGEKLLGDPWELGAELTDLARDQAEWSQATFGSDEVRGPAGPLKHIAREVLTELLGIPRVVVDEALAYARHSEELLSRQQEYADLFILILDASRRAKVKPTDLVRLSRQKMIVNKARSWPKSQDPNAEVEHVRDGEVSGAGSDDAPICPEAGT